MNANAATSLGERLKDARKKRNLTQKELAEKLGLTSVAISRYELGERTPKIEIAQRISDELCVPLEWLLGLSETEPEPERKRSRHNPFDKPRPMFNKKPRNETEDRNNYICYRNLVLRAVVTFISGMILMAFFKTLGFSGLFFGFLLYLFGVVAAIFR